MIFLSSTSFRLHKVSTTWPSAPLRRSGYCGTAAGAITRWPAALRNTSWLSLSLAAVGWVLADSLVVVRRPDAALPPRARRKGRAER